MKAVKYLSGAAMGLALVLASARPASAQGIDLSSFNIPTETGRVAVTYEVTVNWEQTATGKIFTTTDVVVLYWDNGEIVDQRGTVRGAVSLRPDDRPWLRANGLLGKSNSPDLVVAGSAPRVRGEGCPDASTAPRRRGPAQAGSRPASASAPRAGVGNAGRAGRPARWRLLFWPFAGLLVGLA